MGIVVLGAVFVDIKGYPADVYIPGGRNAGRVEQVHGGVSRNLVEDIANVELRPTFISLVDNTGTGADVIRKLQDHKVNTDYIRAVPDGMGTWLAVFDNGGDVVASISKRPDLRPIVDILDDHGDEIFRNADSIALEIDCDKEIVKAVFYYAEKYRKPVFAAVSNMSIAVERRDFLRFCFCFVCNQQEAGILFSEDYDSKTPEELRDILAHHVQAAEIPRMVVTMGAQGAVYAMQDGSCGICPARKVDVKDTTGAGDAFFAGITGALYACSNAALSTTSFAFTNGSILNSVFIVVMVVVGGMGSLTGSVIAAVVLFLLNYTIKNGAWVSALPAFLQNVFTYPMLVYSIALIIVIMFRPRGIMGSKEFALCDIPRWPARLRTWRAARSAGKSVQKEAGHHV